MAIISGNTLDFSGLVLLVALIFGIIRFIYCWITKKEVDWKDAILVSLLVLSAIDFVLLFIATMVYFLFNEIPPFIPTSLIKIALMTSILITLNFIREKYKDIFGIKSKNSFA